MRAWIGGLLLGYPVAYFVGRTLNVGQLAVLGFMGTFLTVSHYLWVRGAADRAFYEAMTEIERRKYPHEDGFSLIEIMLALAIMTIMFAVAGPSMLAMQRASNSLHAHQRVRDVAGAITAYNICENEVPVPSSCASLAPVIPAAGTVWIAGYTYTMTGTAASYTFTATPDIATQLAYYSDNDGLVRCGTGSASGGSGVCQ